jgi:ATP-dependent Clp protease ATP-binding subunit ClpC
MFERFTERARQVVVLAQDEARENRLRYCAPEHILVGLMREEDGLAAGVLRALDVDADKLRRIVKDLGQGSVNDKDELPKLTEPAEKVLEQALRSALALGHNYIGTEHILSGAISDQKIRHILSREFNVAPATVEAKVLEKLSGSEAPILKRKESAPAKPVKAPVDHNLVALAVELGRQYPDRPVPLIVQAARALHG